jgi:hypothetical protein
MCYERQRGVCVYYEALACGLFITVDFVVFITVVPITQT